MTSKEAAKKYYETVYKEKWRGATVKAIVLSSFEAGYNYAKGEGEE
jgi:hypothetical protein